MMHILVAGRGEGKTTKFIDWIKGGVQIPDYPYWTRVGIVHHYNSYMNLKRQYWKEIEDFDHRIYQIHEFKGGHFPSQDTTYRIDDLDLFLWELAHIPNLDGFTITGEPWEDEVIPPSVNQCPNIFMGDSSVIQMRTTSGWVNIRAGYAEDDDDSLNENK